MKVAFIIFFIIQLAITAFLLISCIGSPVWIRSFSDSIQRINDTDVQKIEEIDRTKSGLFRYCAKIEIIALNSTDNGNEAKYDCTSKDIPAWLKSTQGLMLPALFGEVASLFVTVAMLVIAKKNNRESHKKDFYVPLCLHACSVIFTLGGMIVFTLEAPKDIKRNTSGKWKFGYAYYLGWISFVSALLAFIVPVYKLLAKEQSKPVMEKPNHMTTAA